MGKGTTMDTGLSLTRRQALGVAAVAGGVLEGASLAPPAEPARVRLGELKPEHAWLRSARIFALESWWPPFWPHLEVDWDKALWTMKRLRLDTLQANTLTKWACYPTKLVQRHPELGDRDLVMEAQEFCRRNGFKWIIYSLFGHAMPLSSQLSKTGINAPPLFRPMLRDRTKKPLGHLRTVPAEYQDYNTRFHFGDERYVTHCVFAAEDWLTAHIEEIAQRYDYDACWLDGSIGAGEGWSNDGFWNVCVCPVCQKAHIQEFRRPLPLVESPDDPRLLELRRWVLGRLDGVLGRVAALYTKNGRVPLVGNTASGMGTASFHPPIARHLQGGLFEHAPDTLQLAVNLKLSRQMVGVAIHYPDCYDPWPRRVTSGWEVENKGLMIAGYGGTPYLAQPGKYYYDAGNDEPARRIFAFMEKHRGLLDQQAEFARCAVATQPTFHRNPIGDPAATGWFLGLLDSHEAVTAASFHQLEDIRELERYPAWILPNTEYLSDAAIGALRSYVEEGGGVYLSCNAGEIDQNRKPREGGRMRELFDLKPWQPSREEMARRLRFDGRYLGEAPRELQPTYEIYMTVAEKTALGFPLPGQAVQPTHLGSQVPGASWTVLASITPSDGDGPLFPALAVRSLGKGRLVFSSAEWGYQYRDRRAPALAAWMASLSRWLAGGESPYSLSASRAVFCAPNRVKDGWLFYLINNSNDVQQRRQEWGEMMKVWERPLPVGRAELQVRGAAAVEAVYGPQPDETSARGGVLRIVFRDFKDHAVLLVKNAV